MSNYPYEIWDTRRLLGVMRDVKSRANYWLPMFTNQVNSDTDWIEFDKLPYRGRRIAPYVRPAGQGKPMWRDEGKSFRFKPAYVKVKEVVDPFRPLTKIVGVDRSLLDEAQLTPMQRHNALKVQMTAMAADAIQTRLELMAANAIINAADTISGEEYPTQQIDYLRQSANTVVLTSGNRWGDAGVSIIDSIQRWADIMFEAPFGGFPERLTITPKVWRVMRQDAELLKHMDTNLREPRATIERGVIDSERVVPVGNLQVGGASGARIKVDLYRDTYENEAGVETPFMVDGTLVMTANPSRIMGYRCFGAIIDPYAQYRSLEVYGRNWMEQGDPAAEYLLWQSAPLMVPVNPNATFKATPVAL
jgi:hypothetical protein